MRTPDMSDEELDALFQRGAESYPDEHNLSAWLQMEQKLDAAAAQQLVRQRVLRIFALEALLVTVALLVWLGVSAPPQLLQLRAGRLTSTAVQQARLAVAPKPRAASPATAAATRPPTAPAPLGLSVQNTSAATGAASSSPPASADVKSGAGAIKQPARFFLPKAGLGVLVPPTRKPRPAYSLQERVPAAVSVGSGSGEDDSFLQSARRRSATERGILLPTLPDPSMVSVAESAPEYAAGASNTAVSAFILAPTTPTVPAPAAASATGTVAPEAAVAAAAPRGSEPLPRSTSGAALADSAAVATSAATPPPPGTATAAPLPALFDSVPKKTARPRPAYRFSLGLLYAPEVSMVRRAGSAGAGSNLGVLVEYNFTDRLRLNVAALRAVKRYAARGSDYHPPAGYWTKDYVIDQIDATCHITDLPINLRYNVWHRPTGAVFASLGLSTLLMRRERYWYAYHYYGKPVTRDWSLAKGSNHVLSVLNLSAGYERRLPGRWAVQGEPFVKIPLGGVGFGKVKLSSVGAFFSLRYRLLPTGAGSALP